MCLRIFISVCRAWKQSVPLIMCLKIITITTYSGLYGCVVPLCQQVVIGSSNRVYNSNDIKSHTEFVLYAEYSNLLLYSNSVAIKSIFTKVIKCLVPNIKNSNLYLVRYASIVKVHKSF